MKKFLRIVCCVFFIIAQLLLGQQNEPVINEADSSNNEVLLIFLDDYEGDEITDVGMKIGAITNKFLTAFAQGAGPILVSASLIDNARLKYPPTETDVQKRIERYLELESDPNPLSSEQAQEMKNIIRSFVAFDKESAAQWIIKRVNTALYLLIPKEYLTESDIAFSDVELYAPKGPITPVELKLGLKVNHLQTVTNIDTIKKPVPAPKTAYYFTQALYNKTTNSSRIFVINQEYYALGNKDILAWSIYIAGHGDMDAAITHLFIPQFKELLNFLEQHIRTRLFYYWSCYAAGSNAQALYADAKTGIDKTYAFPIITQATTDAPVLVSLITFTDQGDEEKNLFFRENYSELIDLVATPEELDFKKITESLMGPPENLIAALGLLPQIKLPGLPWFQVIHEDRFCSIGKILAQARTRPLNIETFFRRRGKKAAPLGILLYPQDMQFELIINSKTPAGLPPTMISMIPGKATHHIQKLSSSVHSVHELIKSFMQIDDLGPNKLFVIDEITSKAKCDPDKVQDVVIELTFDQNTVYYMHAGQLFKNMKPTTKKEDIEQYKQLLCAPI